MIPMRRLSILLLTVVLAAAPARAGDILVITSPALEPGLVDWLAHRRAQGHDVAIERIALTGEENAEKRLSRSRALIERIRKATPRFVLIAGDASIVPPVFVSIQRIGPFESDHLYSLPKENGVPSVHVGRVPASDAASLRAALAKVIRYETTFTPGEARNTVQLLLGQTLMGDEPDMVYTGLARQTAAVRLDQHYLVKMLNAWPKSRGFVSAERFPAAICAALEANPMVVCFCGHGSETGFAGVHVARKRYPMFDATHVPGLACGPRSPIVFSFCCSTGDFEKPERPGLCARLCLEPRGPIAAFGASRVSFSLPNLALVRGLIARILNERPATLGEAITGMRRYLDTHRSPMMKTLFAAVEGESETFEGVREAHQFMYHLFGDPSLRLRFPRRSASVSAEVTPGRIVVRGTVDGVDHGTAIVRLCADRRRAGRPPRAGESPAAAADDRTFARVEVPVRGGRFEAPIDLASVAEARRPALTTGRLFLRVYASNDRADAVGSATIAFDDVHRFVGRP